MPLNETSIEIAVMNEPMLCIICIFSNVIQTTGVIIQNNRAQSKNYSVFFDTFGIVVAKGIIVYKV